MNQGVTIWLTLAMGIVALSSTAAAKNATRPVVYWYYSAPVNLDFSLAPANSRAFGTKTTPRQMPSPN